MRFYIDPGTGSMLFTILVGVLGAAVFAFRGLFVKLRFLVTGGKRGKADTKREALVIYAESKRYWNVFSPICDELEKRGQRTVYCTSSEDDPVFSMGYTHIRPEYIGTGNAAYAKLNMLRADVLLSTTPGLDVYQWKRSRDVKCYVHIPHMANDITTYRVFGLDYYDAVLLGGDYQTAQIRALEAQRDIRAKELAVIGVTYFDAMKTRLEALGPAPAHPTTVLLAPSWGPSGILSRYGEKAIDALLAAGYHLVIRPHPQSFTSEKALLDRLMAKYPQSGSLEWNRDADNFEILRRSDILVSDFSGVLFDFSLVFDKPIVYADTSFDDAPYDAHWLKEPLWTFSVLPKLGRQLTGENLDHIGEIIDGCLHDTCYKEARKQARAEAWANEGRAALLAADWLCGKLADLKTADGHA